jgi:hypothetical protein
MFWLEQSHCQTTVKTSKAKCYTIYFLKKDTEISNLKIMLLKNTILTTVINIYYVYFIILYCIILYSHVTSGMHTSKKDISMNQKTWFHFPHTLLFKNSSSIQLSHISSATNLRKNLDNVTACFCNCIPKLHQVLTEKNEETV